MSIARKVTTLGLTLIGLCALSFGQTTSPAATAVAGAKPDMGTLAAISVTTVQTGSLSSVGLDVDTGAVVSGGSAASFNSNAKTSSTSQSSNDDDFDIDNRRANKSTIDGLDTIATFSGAFVAQAGPQAGQDFRFTMVGNDPKLGGTTVYPANVDEISLQLLNADGSVFTTVSSAPFAKLFLESPDFEPLDYRSGHNVEYGDAVHRAQFFNVMKNDWHTLMIPKVVNKVTITVPFFVNVQLRNGTV